MIDIKTSLPPIGKPRTDAAFRLIKQGKTPEEITELWGTAITTVRDALLKSPGYLAHRAEIRAAHAIRKAKAAELYQQGLTAPEIATELKTTLGAVHTMLVGVTIPVDLTNAKRGRTISRKRPVATPLGEFPSLREACRAHKVNRSTAHDWAANEQNGWRFLAPSTYKYPPEFGQKCADSNRARRSQAIEAEWPIVATNGVKNDFNLTPEQAMALLRSGHTAKNIADGWGYTQGGMSVFLRRIPEYHQWAAKQQSERQRRIKLAQRLWRQGKTTRDIKAVTELGLHAVLAAVSGIALSAKAVRRKENMRTVRRKRTKQAALQQKKTRPARTVRAKIKTQVTRGAPIVIAPDGERFPIGTDADRRYGLPIGTAWHSARNERNGWRLEGSPRPEVNPRKTGTPGGIYRSCRAAAVGEGVDYHTARDWASTGRNGWRYL